jgi:hypothetical protein
MQRGRPKNESVTYCWGRLLVYLQCRIWRPENAYGGAVLVDVVGKRVIVGKFVCEQSGERILRRQVEKLCPVMR